jgi:hypothetical protein
MRAFCSTSKTVVVRRISEMIRKHRLHDLPVAGRHCRPFLVLAIAADRENRVLFKDSRAGSKS